MNGASQRRYSSSQRRAIQTCGRKRRYATTRGAKSAAEGAVADGGATLMAAYICPVCDGIHLTSSPRRGSTYLFEVRP